MPVELTAIKSWSVDDQKRFIAGLFGDEAQRAWVCAFDSQEASNWTGAPWSAWTPGGAAAANTQDAYVCNGVYTAGATRAKTHVEKILFFVFDDVGTKVDREHVRQRVGAMAYAEIETSPGNETWIVKASGVDTPEAITRYLALQRALGRAGLTDPAMKDATRYVRAPWGHNSKSQHRNPVTGEPARVVLRQYRERAPSYTIDELARAVGIDLDAEMASEKTASAALAGQTLLAAGQSNDPYVRALDELNLILGRRHNGWLDIRCPWEHEHSTRAATGTAYLPGGGWECHHGHCANRDTEAFKSEIRRQLDARKVPGGATGFLASNAFPAADESVMSPEELSLIAGLERQMLAAYGSLPGSGRASGGEADGPLAAFLADTVYIRNSDRFFSLGSGTVMNRAALNTAWRRPLSSVLARNKQGRVVEAPAELFARSDGAVMADVPVYWPGRPRVFEHDAQVRLNTWRAPRWTRLGRKIETWEIRPWLRLVLDLCNGNRRDARVLLDHMARVVAVPDWKPGFAIIIQGTQGIGKDLALSVLSRALGQHNLSVITPDRIGTRFNADTERRAVIVNEMKMTTRGALTAHDQYNALKTLAAPLPEWVRVERKGLDAYMIPNRCAWYFTTNEDAPIALDDADRRFFVIACQRKTRRAEEFYARIVEWLDVVDGHGLVAEWLEQRGQRLEAGRVRFLSGNAPMTAAKEDMIARAPRLGRSNVSEVADWIGRTQDEWPELVTADDVVAAAMSAAKAGVELDRDMRIPRPDQLAWAFKKLGWERVSGSNPVPMPLERGGKTRHVWARRDADRHRVSRGELARRYADGWGVPAPKGLAHGSAEGSNVVVLSGPVPTPVDTNPGVAAPKTQVLPAADADYPF